MQDIGTKTRDDSTQVKRKRRADRRVQELPETSDVRYIDITDEFSRRARRSRFSMSEHRDGNTFGRKAAAQIRTCTLDTARMRGKKLADVQNAHRRVSGSQRYVESWRLNRPAR